MSHFLISIAVSIVFSFQEKNRFLADFYITPVRPATLAFSSGSPPLPPFSPMSYSVSLSLPLINLQLLQTQS